ncbi:peroxiredoxin Q/BCP [Ekhidna lutea]|uniref:thioredoxin-dependent peroxiredoxin n=1 Tax=Ekhidna lutea TaxID=447679 RepID=A0A239GJB2_EKHLU|nr:peroxiredoxin [Ekhidna lutea]SNS68868.1 peroxiredoxin Q/BCP [Ekhidna lutea]
MLQKGELIPDLTLEDQDGKMVSFHDYKGKQPLVIYFYPKDNTRVCTQQACSFRDNYEDFKAAGAEVIGISKDSPESHKKVANRRELPFKLLSDPKKEAQKAFKVSSILGLLPGRATFVVNKEGIIIHTFRAEFQSEPHIKGALKVLNEQ